MTTDSTIPEDIAAAAAIIRSTTRQDMSADFPANRIWHPSDVALCRRQLAESLIQLAPKLVPQYQAPETPGNPFAGLLQDGTPPSAQDLTDARAKIRAATNLGLVMLGGGDLGVHHHTAAADALAAFGIR